jgi:transcriptional pleiotropic regulator of transition state genes
VVKLAKVKIDRFGRILIPKRIRESLGIRENSELEIEIEDEKILIKPQNSNLERRVDELINYLKNNAPKPFVSEKEVEEKWYTREYSLKKIGLGLKE